MADRPYQGTSYFCLIKVLSNSEVVNYSHPLFCAINEISFHFLGLILLLQVL